MSKIWKEEWCDSKHEGHKISELGCYQQLQIRGSGMSALTMNPV